MIDLVQDSLTTNGFSNSFTRLDGSMPLPQRDRALRDFQYNKGIPQSSNKEQEDSKYKIGFTGFCC